MRSRYSAHVLGKIDYLLATHDPATRARVDRGTVGRWARESEWLGLRVLAVERGGAEHADGMVEFEARYRLEGVAGGAPGLVLAHHERSRFRRHQGAWCYVDGERVKPRPAQRAAGAGRNDPCPCGSGKKYKRCCGP